MKIILLLAACFSFGSLYSQDTVFVLDKKFKAGIQPRSFKVLQAPDKKNNELHISLVDNNSIERFILDDHWKVIDQFSAKRGVYDVLPYKRFDDMQLFTDGKKEFAIYSYNSEGKDFIINEIDFNTKQEKKTATFSTGKHESAIVFFSDEGFFCLITASKKNGEVLLVNNLKQGGIIFDTARLELNYGDDKAASKLLKDAVFVKPYEDNIDNLASPRKIYYANDKVYISSDIKDNCFITEINLRTGDTKHKIFKQATGTYTGKINKPAISSFLCGDRFVTANFLDDLLSISVYDYEAEKLLNVFVQKNEAENIGFINGPVFNAAGKPVLKNDEKAATPAATKKFFKSLKDGLAVRLEKNNKDSLLLLVKSYVEIVQRGGGAPIMAGAPGSTYWIATASGGHSSLQPDYYIHLLFTEDHAEHIATAESKNSIAELVNTAFDGNRNNDTQIVFKKNGETYVGCYDSKKDLYIIKRIEDNP